MKYLMYRALRVTRHQFFWALLLATLVLVLMMVTLLRVEASGPDKRIEPGDGYGGGGVSAGAIKGAAVRLYTLFATVDITNPANGKCMSFSKYWDLIKYHYRGWSIVGEPYVKGGRWYIKITRTVSY